MTGFFLAALVVPLLGQPKQTPTYLNGTWPVTANLSTGSLTLKVAADNTVTGTLFGEEVQGSVTPSGTFITFRRFASVGKTGRRVVQVYSGTITQNDAFRPDVSFASGQFYESDDAGQPLSATRYTWVATIGLDSQPKNLKELQGTWRVTHSYGAQYSAATLCEKTGLDQEGIAFTVVGNELRRDGKVVATLKNELPNLADHRPVFFRRLIELTLTGGEKVLCAYGNSSGQWELVTPYSVVTRGGFHTFLKKDGK